MRTNLSWRRELLLCVALVVVACTTELAWAQDSGNRIADGFPIGAGRDKFGLGFEIATSVPVGDSRAPGSYGWAGSNNTFFWVDPERGIAVVLLMHYLPFHDETAQMVYDGFERRVYASLD